MKNTFLLILFFLFFSISAQNSKIIASKINSVSSNNKEFVGRDQFGYNYYIDNAIFYKIKNQEHWEYKNVSLGALTKVDLNNPLKIVLFYENFNTVVILDNQLSETQKINFSENTNPITVTATGIAGQNQLWIYNRLNQQIGFYDYLKNTYRTISTPFPETMIYYQSDFNHFYWIDDKKNAFVCSIYGKISNLGKVSDFEWFEFINEFQYIYSKNKQLFLVDSTKNKKYEIEILEKTFDKCYYKDQILSIFTTEGITNYKIITP
ncbi:hypothetical protein SLW70_05470 [Flavobacterium sp. NG2]|uniref:hypothetical protein n=1 Tax=Flavobacterium sp. NG2 TaxID=3097547 RepID=UPI002A7FCF91|nr:hypothetical protein [Flavobacterium sp. NG2]WPR72587.1 hypothetical protein SLW70_05470 [Flavobacterium sp. NG2]